ncbi:unnamed protein product [Lymnaea stagnalis]|uniref:BTB domain-containing protein n=1 Tax=Lymnaea stagnalis TaxID=6523 RepID=A0AAV2IQX5_LYMST
MLSIKKTTPSSTMNKGIHQRCAFGIINCIQTLWQEQDLQDFNFQVDDTSFHCHRVLLGACSPVLRGMFKSGMKEDKEGFARLQEISKETFQLIITVLYTGRDVLTVDNVIDIWKAAHMLQIDFLVKHCEKCATKFIKTDNFHEFNENAKLFGSETVLKVTRKFILKNFNAVRKTQGFLKMSSNEVLSIVKRQDLVVSSEDIVLEAILDWADYYKDEPASEQSLDVNGTKCQRGSNDYEQAENVRSVGNVNTEGSDVNHQKEERRDKTREEDNKENDALTRSQSQAVHRKSRL